MSLKLPAPDDMASPGPESGAPGSGAPDAAAPEGAAAPASTPAPAAKAAVPGAKVRLRALDGLRLVAALMVCFYHLSFRGSAGWQRSPLHVFPHLSHVSAYGPLGVQFFFIISGFVICMSGWGRTVRVFAISRISRLYPAYWAALVVVTAVLYFLGERTVSRTDFLTNFTMLQTPAGAERVLGVSWTLWAEARFYVLFAVAVLWRGATRKRVLGFCALWTVAALYADSSDQEFLKVALMPEYAPFFIGGIGLYMLRRYGHDLLTWGVVASGFLLGQHYAVKGLVAPPGAHAAFERSATVVIAAVAAGFAGVALVTLFRPVADVDWRWLTTAGALTYPFYLVHEILGTLMIGKLRAHTGLSDYEVLAVTVLAMLLLAYLIHRLVERPLTPLLRRLLTKQANGLGAARPARESA
ncbi:Peptidoglycan/LPS O-acetylase OafA/YrhL, contains acyltransferase and SGNH-hydrolase domains [Actinacidiphila alni]|uniref:Peptidoglycan/LPS O-acetylase OafA/YrhL, contains acyltransferase and SGNH-hydrolase domains n=1 Tax=Actinacidiphila alni TaxID=380248 RepID=A0A1I1YWN7_9ACTN|nr:acyltransferase [Actinacidiphila alni]SFE22573.1 Peptidoglycan/LPS O-acetylase OafA/YrhL, contains acyltransferase and SGNH-hydrolase domains [Actinacidiphila alni]